MALQQLVAYGECERILGIQNKKSTKYICESFVLHLLTFKSPTKGQFQQTEKGWLIKPVKSTDCFPVILFR